MIGRWRRRPKAASWWNIRGPISPNMIAERRLLNNIVASVIADVQPGWTTIKVRFDVAGMSVSAFAYAELPAGSSVVVGLPREVMELRQVMYVPGRGTWFTMWLSIAADGAIGVRFGRDRPQLNQPLADLLLDDLRLYPRESVPDWIRAELDGHHVRGGTPLSWPDRVTTPSTCCNSEEECDCIDRAAAIERAADFAPEDERTRYLKVVHYSEFDHIALSYSEILATGDEWRRVERLRDGGCGLAAFSGRTEFTRLSGHIPSTTDISASPQLSAEEITPVEFQTEWLTVGGW